MRLFLFDQGQKMHEGAFNKYVDIISSFFEHLPTLESGINIPLHLLIFDSFPGATALFQTS